VSAVREPGMRAGRLVTKLPKRARRIRCADRRPARIAQMLALAHHIEAGLEAGTWASASEVARLLGMSRNRLHQVLSLTYLAPDIQEHLLHLEVTDGVEPVSEKWLFAQVARCLNWSEQRGNFARPTPMFGRGPICS